jgi:hypothetical protein
MKPQKKCILVVSNEPWGEMWFSKQRYANELQKMGHDVSFYNPPKRWSIFNVFKKLTVTIENGIKVIDCYNILPINNRTYFIVLNDKINLRKLKRRGLYSTDTLIWNFDPNRFCIPLPRVIYHVTDSFLEFPLNNLIAENAGLVVCTVPNFVPDYSENVQRKTMVIPHGISS